MRMWMINPIFMCKSHLLGEHNEIHKLYGWLKTGKSIAGWVENNCLELLSIYGRHAVLTKEMLNVGKGIQSPKPP